MNEVKKVYETNAQESAALIELSDTQLAFVGGGIGDVVGA